MTIILSDMRWHGIGALARIVYAVAIGCVALNGTVETRAQSLPRANAAPDPALRQTIDPVRGDLLAFDVVSIRQNRSGGAQQFGATSNGYRMTNMPLLMPIITAYIPSTGPALFAPGSLSGAPGWAQSDRFDIDARVSQADLANWQKPDLQPAMLRSMLQAMLRDRLKLTVHREMKEVPVYFLVLGKNGPKFNKTVPGENHPNGRKLPGNGGVMTPDEGVQMIHFYETPMSSLAFLLADLVRRPVQDKTGLTGEYDFAIPKPAEMGGEGASGVDPAPTIYSVLGDIGLKLELTKGSVETLVIDHVEHPSEN